MKLTAQLQSSNESRPFTLWRTVANCGLSSQQPLDEANDLLGSGGHSAIQTDVQKVTNVKREAHRSQGLTGDVTCSRVCCGGESAPGVLAGALVPGDRSLGRDSAHRSSAIARSSIV
jgi:hypothetical protein